MICFWIMVTCIKFLNSNPVLPWGFLGLWSGFVLASRRPYEDCAGSGRRDVGVQGTCTRCWSRRTFRTVGA